MLWSHFNHKGQWLEMRDFRLSDLITYAERFLPEFVESHGNQEQLRWLNEAMSQWKDECQLPPGCKTIQFDAWLDSTERRLQLSRFFSFVATKIRTTMAATEAVMADEAEKVQKFIVESAAQTNAGVPPKGQ